MDPSVVVGPTTVNVLVEKTDSVFIGMSFLVWKLPAVGRQGWVLV